MGFVIENRFLSLRVALTWLRLVGLWSPDIIGWKKILYHCLTIFMFMSVVGVFVVIQTVDLCNNWGDIPLMTAAAFVLFTNITHISKIVNILVRVTRIKAIVDNNCRVLSAEDNVEGRKIVDSCNRKSLLLFGGYWLITTLTGMLWSTAPLLDSGSKLLPIRAWYPFDTSKSPLYEFAFAHQSIALYMSAMMNVSKDTVVTALIAQCRCRLLLVRSALQALGDDVTVVRYRLTKKQEARVRHRFNESVKEHQDVLETVVQLQDCFSEPTFVQFTVSLIIICVTAFQLVFLTGKPIRMLSMACYLFNMLHQVFIYCYEGNELSIESENISRAAYEFPWYTCSVSTRRSVLIMMTRGRRIAKLTAAGFTTLSLASFMSICKASYSFFTVLQQVDEDG